MKRRLRNALNRIPSAFCFSVGYPLLLCWAEYIRCIVATGQYVFWIFAWRSVQMVCVDFFLKYFVCKSIITCLIFVQTWGFEMSNISFEIQICGVMIKYHMYWNLTIIWIFKIYTLTIDVTFNKLHTVVILHDYINLYYRNYGFDFYPIFILGLFLSSVKCYQGKVSLYVRTVQYV